MENEIKVSVSCITYNHEKYIEQAIQSFLMQKTDFKYEILIHDDASTDSTADIIKKYQQMYPDIIKPVLQSENQYSRGVKHISYTYNFNRAKGKYIALCEGDDYWTDKYKLQKQVDYMESDSECTLCTHSVKRVGTESGNDVGLIRPSKVNRELDIREFILGGGMFIGTNSILFPKKIIDDLPTWFFDAHAGDYPLQIFLANYGKAYYIDETMSAYRVNVQGSWTNRVYFSYEQRIEHFKRVAKMLDEINEYTEYKYNKEVEIRKRCNLKDVVQYTCYILMKEGRFDELNKGKFKRFYNELSNQEKVELYVSFRGIRL